MFLQNSTVPEPAEAVETADAEKAVTEVPVTEAREAGLGARAEALAGREGEGGTQTGGGGGGGLEGSGLPVRNSAHIGKTAV